MSAFEPVFERPSRAHALFRAGPARRHLGRARARFVARGAVPDVRSDRHSSGEARGGRGRARARARRRWRLLARTGTSQRPPTRQRRRRAATPLARSSSSRTPPAPRTRRAPAAPPRHDRRARAPAGLDGRRGRGARAGRDDDDGVDLAADRRGARARGRWARACSARRSAFARDAPISCCRRPTRSRCASTNGAGTLIPNMTKLLRARADAVAHRVSSQCSSRGRALTIRARAIPRSASPTGARERAGRPSAIRRRRTVSRDFARARDISLDADTAIGACDRSSVTMASHHSGPYALAPRAARRQDGASSASIAERDEAAGDLGVRIELIEIPAPARARRAGVVAQSRSGDPA